MTSAQMARYCLKAADLIAERGLAKHRFMNNNGALCIHGAYNLASRGQPYHVGRVPFGSAAAWNDHRSTTADEVIALLQSWAYSLLPRVPR